VLHDGELNNLADRPEDGINEGVIREMDAKDSSLPAVVAGSAAGINPTEAGSSTFRIYERAGSYLNDAGAQKKGGI